ncbi:hypothetical protein ABIG06_006817 [Bradyrhizobium sp. USDA 326]|uniref:hypothetical protein n=1 Tax=Bradyrhizobium sp. USDA 326 TaxID=3377726 RepID=UPI003C779DAD
MNDTEADVFAATNLARSKHGGRKNPVVKRRSSKAALPHPMSSVQDAPLSADDCMNIEPPPNVPQKMNMPDPPAQRIGSETPFAVRVPNALTASTTLRVPLHQ